MEEGACATNQEQMSKIGVDLDEDGLNSIDGYNKEQFINSNGEKSDESDDMQNIDFVMFSEPSLKRSKSMSHVDDGSQVKRTRQSLHPH
ncbi:L10-interacting MYB domain-containing protein-like [Capsicum galapagoense]